MVVPSAASFVLLASDAGTGGGGSVVQRLVAVCDLRAVRPDDPGNDDDRELRLRPAAAPPRPGPHDPLRVGRVAGPAEATALHRQLLPDGDALHPLRHRYRVPVPAGGDPARPRLVP